MSSFTGSGLSCHTSSLEMTAWTNLALTFETVCITDPDLLCKPLFTHTITGSGNSVILRDSLSSESYLHSQWCQQKSSLREPVPEVIVDSIPPWRKQSFLAQFPQELTIPFKLVGACTPQGMIGLQKFNLPHQQHYELVYSGNISGREGVQGSLPKELGLKLSCSHAVAVLQLEQSDCDTDARQ
jgi:hypothetical protein